MARVVHTSLLIIGGAEDKVGRTTVLRRFVGLAGGSKARIVVIPTASSVPDEAAETYTAIFSRLGAPEIVTVDPPRVQLPGMRLWFTRSTRPQASS